MSRNNKLTQVVLSEIIGTDSKVSKFHQFIHVDKLLGVTETPELKDCLKLYGKLATKNLKEIVDMAKLEEIIVQLRCREQVMEEFKLSKVREYIYARALFYRSEKDVKDIRVVVGRTDIWGDDIDKLLGNEEFVKLSVTKLKEVMTIEIDENLKYFETLKEKYNS